MAYEPALIVITSALASLGLGVYGLAASRNIIRQLLSIEVIFNAVLILIVVSLSGKPLLATLLGAVLVTVVAGEVIVVMAIVASFYRRSKTFDSRVLEEKGV